MQLVDIEANVVLRCMMADRHAPLPLSTHPCHATYHSTRLRCGAYLGDDFSVGANLQVPLGRYGPGVYTITLWGVVDGEDVPVMEYSIFYRIPYEDAP